MSRVAESVWNEAAAAKRLELRIDIKAVELRTRRGAPASRPLRVSAERRWRRLLARAEQECGPIDHARACLARPDPSHLSI